MGKVKEMGGFWMVQDVAGEAVRALAGEAVSDSRFQPGDFGGVHFGEAEALASEVFQGGPDEVEFAVVDGEEPVVEGGALPP